MKYVLQVLLILVTPLAFGDDLPIALEKASVNIHDTASIKRGAQFFARQCMVCHTLIYLRYNKLAIDSGVLYNKMPIDIKKWPFDVKPPDLSLEESRRGADWIYTYLHSFYVDTKRPTGVNNLLVNNTAMSGILVPFQGRQILLPKEKWSKAIYSDQYQWYDLVEIEQSGTMTPAQFDALVLDIVNFLTYASAPYTAEQEQIGVWVLGYLIILFIFVFYLKKSYWKKLEK